MHDSTTDSIQPIQHLRSVHAETPIPSMLYIARLKQPTRLPYPHAKLSKTLYIHSPMHSVTNHPYLNLCTHPTRLSTPHLHGNFRPRKVGSKAYLSIHPPRSTYPPTPSPSRLFTALLVCNSATHIQPFRAPPDVSHFILPHFLHPPSFLHPFFTLPLSFLRSS